jgi:rubrerythrin
MNVRSAEPASAGHGEPKVELRCSACGYGVVVRIAPVNCPMCNGSVWEYAGRTRPRASAR